MEEQPKTIQEQIEVPGFLRISKVVVWAVYAFIILGIVSLFLRVLLLAFSADRSAGFSQLVSDISSDYLEPFRGIFPPGQVGETGYLDVSALFAIVVYLFIAWGVHSLIGYVQGKIDLSKAEQKARLLELARLARIEEAKKEKAAAAAARAKATKPKAKKVGGR